MNSFLNLVEISPELLTFLAIDLVIAIAFLGAMRFVSGVTAKVDTTDELSRRDNFAFGISVAGSIFALGIVLSGAVTGATAESLQLEALGMLVYGVIGLLFIKFGRQLHDKIALNRINKMQLIQDQNVSVAIVDASTAIATALIIRAVLLWVEGLNEYTLLAIVTGFLVSQAVLLTLTRIMESRFASDNQNDSLQLALANGNTALAIRHSGYILGTALAVTAGSSLLVYEATAIVSNLTGWLVVGVAMTLILQVLIFIAKKLVLKGINLVEEVDQQENIGVAAIELCITVALALVLIGLLS